MTLRRLRISLVATVLVVVAAVGGTVASGDEPVLGLDLQGGISVVLAPVGEFRPGSLDVALDIIRERVDGLGVAEPEISRQGDNIVVDLPGVEDRDKARRVVGQTAELRFRPVIAELPPAGEPITTTTSTAPGTTAPGAPSTTTSSTTTSSTTTSTTTPIADEAARAAVASCNIEQVAVLPDVPTTSRQQDERDECVVLGTRPQEDEPSTRRYLAPTFRDSSGFVLTGNGVRSARATFQTGQGWVVNVRFNDRGAAAFDELAAQSVSQSPPQNRVAIVLDAVVQSDPAFQASSFQGDVEISGNFSQTEAEDLATVINYGALPVQLEELSVQNVSPTLGKDQLRAGIAAGIIGLALVALYMFLYYRLLGLVVILGLFVAGGLTYALIAFLGDAIGLTLTLAGVTGLIVSVGVTVDSYVVYFERLKDEVRSGKTVRSSVDRGFTRAFRTIVAADLVSLIGAAALYLLAIGSVRGFALFLGIEIALDLLISYFFMHPLVSLMARRPNLVRMRGVGIAAGLDAPEVTT